MNVIKNYHFLPINFVFLHTRQCWNSNYQFVTKNVTKKMEYKLRKRRKKNESKIYIIISYSVVVLAKLSEITQPWNCILLNLQYRCNMFIKGNVLTHECLRAITITGRATGSCILRESHANRISQISEKPRCTFKCVGVITIRSRDI